MEAARSKAESPTTLQRIWSGAERGHALNFNYILSSTILKVVPFWTSEYLIERLP